MSRESHFIKASRCPKCRDNGGDRAGNNLAEYSDGHCYCYACGYFTPADQSGYPTGITRAVRSKSNSFWFTPTSVSFAGTGLSWLKSYGLTNKEIEDNYFWDDAGYCVFNTDGYQNARNFNEGGTKYITRGEVKGNEHIFLSNNVSLLSYIVVTEDAISAIKVSRTCNAVAAHKATLGLELIIRLSRQFKHLIIWLDKDRASKVGLEATKASPYFDTVRVIISDKDPKEYDDRTIASKVLVD